MDDGTGKSVVHGCFSVYSLVRGGTLAMTSITISIELPATVSPELPGSSNPVIRRELLWARDGALADYVWFSSIVFGLVFSWIGWMQFQEGHNPRCITDVFDLEFYCPPPERSYKTTPSSAPAQTVAQAKLTPVMPVSMQQARTPSFFAHPVQVLAALRQPAQAASLDNQAQSPMASSQAEPAQTEASAEPQSAPAPEASQTAQAEAIKTETPSPAAKGDQKSLAGSNFGDLDTVQDQSKTALQPRVMGDIRPYTRQIVAKIAESWHPTVSYGEIVVSLTIGRDGMLKSHRIVQGSGDQAIDESLTAALGTTAFAPLPQWYRSEQLKFQIRLSE